MQDERYFKKGSYIFIEGDEETNSVFLVKKGKVSHICSSPILSSALKDAGEGDFFGFISAFSGKPRLSSAVAIQDTIVVDIDRELLFKMLNDKTEIAMKIMNSYSHALQKYDNVLMGIKPISLIYPQSLSLLRLGEYYLENGCNTPANYVFNRYMQLFPDSENISDIQKYIDDTDDPSNHSFFFENEKGDLLYRDGAVIFCEYEPGENLFFIVEGRVKIIKQSKNRDMLLAVLGEGDIFGELALLTKSPRSATAVSFGGTRITPVDMNIFKSHIKHSPDLIKKIITSISQRLWFNHVRLNQMSYKNPITRLFTFLESKLLEDGVSLKRKKPSLLQFGLDELIEMNELSQEENSEEITELLSCRYLSFNFGTITVSNPLEFSSLVQTYKKKDFMTSFKHKKTVKNVSQYNQDDNHYTPDAILHKEIEVESDPDFLFTREFYEILPELNSEDPMKRVNAVIKLGNLGEKAKESVPLLRERLSDNIKVIRRNASRSIINILSPDESFKLFIEAIKEDNQEIRSAAIAGLSELNIAEKSEIVDLLVKSLKDKSDMVRSSTIRSLGSLGIDAENAIPHLLKLLTDKEVSVRILTVNSLESITGPEGYINEVIEAIKKISKNDPDRFVKNSAKDALIKLIRKKKHH